MSRAVVPPMSVSRPKNHPPGGGPPSRSYAGSGGGPGGGSNGWGAKPEPKGPLGGGTSVETGKPGGGPPGTPSCGLISAGRNGGTTCPGGAWSPEKTGTGGPLGGGPKS